MICKFKNINKFIIIKKNLKINQIKLQENN